METVGGKYKIGIKIDCAKSGKKTTNGTFTLHDGSAYRLFAFEDFYGTLRLARRISCDQRSNRETGTSE
ncbi:hypothetical protein DPMN_188562 [Dreissena polymorpha]|uniref:Uncharacterized protein n=1 Tax=Dreissena polymorpha TaxID=45954 RepID=A0A9D4I8M2_DREPO|nr:hypothetical protein DPMN_188562 [Dreissena polymorpha]